MDVLVDGLERVLEKREFREKTKRIREMVREEQEKGGFLTVKEREV